jgi:hypothetical protein
MHGGRPACVARALGWLNVRRVDTSCTCPETRVGNADIMIMCTRQKTGRTIVYSILHLRMRLGIAINPHSDMSVAIPIPVSKQTKNANICCQMHLLLYPFPRVYCMRLR